MSEDKIVVVCDNGSYGSWQKSCPQACPYFDSCKEYSKPIENHAKVRNAVDYDKNHYRASIKTPDEVENTDVGVVLRLILSLDSEQLSKLQGTLKYISNLPENSFLCLRERILYPNASQAELARMRGVSRQRLNTSLLYATRDDEDMASVMNGLAHKNTLVNNRYSKKSKETQPELGFDLE